MITSLLFFLTNTVVKRASHGQKWGWFMAALIVGTIISGLANADVMSRQWVYSFLQGNGIASPVQALIGLVVTGGLILFAGMDSFDERSKLEKSRATRAKNKAAREEAARKAKFTPKAKREVISLPSVKARRAKMNP
jgi:hypothetical protein